MRVHLVQDALPPPSTPTSSVGWLVLVTLGLVVVGAVVALVAIARRRR